MDNLFLLVSNPQRNKLKGIILIADKRYERYFRNIVSNFFIIILSSRQTQCFKKINSNSDSLHPFEMSI